jgi:hypothetical protein
MRSRPAIRTYLVQSVGGNVDRTQASGFGIGREEKI